MGKSYNNVIKLTELFSGNHPLLSQAFHPMTVRFFILQSHYRSTLDFSNEALTASEKALKRLWESYANLNKIPAGKAEAADRELDSKLNRWLDEFEEFMDDDFSTPRILANMFEMAPVINSIKDRIISPDAISASTLARMQSSYKTYLEDIMGLKDPSETKSDKLSSVMDLLIEIRKEAKTKKDYSTSDKIRNQLLEMGILLKDEKDGGMSWTVE